MREAIFWVVIEIYLVFGVSVMKMFSFMVIEYWGRNNIINDIVLTISSLDMSSFNLFCD